jgi:hypothetical protein
VVGAVVVTGLDGGGQLAAEMRGVARPVVGGVADQRVRSRVELLSGGIDIDGGADDGARIARGRGKWSSRLRYAARRQVVRIVDVSSRARRHRGVKMSVVSDMMSPIRSRRLSAVSPRRGQSSGVIPIALRVRNFRRLTTRMRVSTGVAVLVVLATVVLLVVSTVPSGVRPSASTALIVGFCLLHVIVGAVIHLLVRRP